MSGSVVPSDDLRRVADAQRRFEVALGALDDDAMRKPSCLPNWSVGHVLTHVARNADSHVRRTEAATRGEMIDQYAGGYEGRRREIEEGSAWSAVELIADVRNSGQRLHDAWSSVPECAWAVITRDVGGRERPLSDLPARRWQELEVHLVDLGVGASYQDWSDDFVGVWLPRLRASLPKRLPTGTHEPTQGHLSERLELAWLYGRFTREDLPTLTPWG